MGNNFFKMKIDSMDAFPNILPPFHTLSSTPKFHPTFKVHLQRANSLSKPLVSNTNLLLKIFQTIQTQRNLQIGQNVEILISCYKHISDQLPMIPQKFI
jgi:hypothetical protein